MLLSLCISAEAQEFFNLTAAQVKIDSLLPVFTWQKALGPHYADSVYTASIEYPEFIEMSKADIRRYQDVSGVPLPELPIVTLHSTLAWQGNRAYWMCHWCRWHSVMGGITNLSVLN